MRAEIEVEEHRRAVSLHYLNAKLGRAEKMPPLRRILGSTKPANAPKPTLKSIVARLKAKSPQE